MMIRNVTMDMEKINEEAKRLLILIADEAMKVAEENKLTYIEYRALTYEILMTVVSSMLKTLIASHNEFVRQLEV